MKEIEIIVFPAVWTGTRPNLPEQKNSAVASIKKFIKEGWNLTHTTSSTINDIMYVYHTFEREVKE